MSIYTIHKSLQALAFLVLFPLGALTALLRQRIGPSWLMWHIGFQLTASIAVFSAVAIVVFLKPSKQKEEEHEENKFNKLHKIIGPLVTLLIVMQLAWAFGGKGIVSLNTWYVLHVVFAILIVGLGWTNLYIGYRMTH